MFSEKGQVGQANFQKHKSGHEQSTVDNEEHTGINWGKCFCIVSSCYQSTSSSSLVGHKRKIKFLLK